MPTEELLPPNYSKLDGALRSIGYSFEVAVADIIDNAIDAKAKNVLVRLVIRRDSRLDLVICDDGTGMNERTLREAMRFGSDVSQDIQRLGKFGLGLKLASLSQAREVRVVSLHGAKFSGRAWLESGISRAFTSTIFSQPECKRLLARVLGDRPLKRSGTAVWWSHLYRVGHSHKSPEEHAQKLMRRLEKYLALAFHRFLSGRARKVAITVDIFDERAGLAGIPALLDALDPFAYVNSGRSGYPAPMKVEGEFKDLLTIKAHIWPSNANSPEYKLPGGSNARQGFYFYRNDRLIQGGGWNGLREAEPHGSLARLEIDLAPAIDVEVSLDVKKVEIQLSPQLATAIQHAKTASGVDLRKFSSLARESYSKRTLATSELPLIPSSGLPSALTRFLRDELRLSSTKKHRDLKIGWRDMDDETFFEIDRDTDSLHINRRYRKALLQGASASAADLPVLKCLLFLALKDALLSERTGPRIRDFLQQANRILVQAAKHETKAQ